MYDDGVYSKPLPFSKALISICPDPEKTGMNREKDEIGEELLVSLLCSLMVLICLYIFVVYHFQNLY